MKIEQIRVYAEVLEQGIDFKEYIENSGIKCSVISIYSHKARGEISETDSIVTRIRKSKDVDVLITAISDCKEYPLLMVEYSTAVPADDHIMQRSDVYYWGAIYRVPVMKIYPLSKGMNQDFGGGDKIKPEDEMLISKRFGAIFYPIFWNTIENTDVLETKKYALSCIYKNTEIQEKINSIVLSFQTSKSHDDFYISLFSKYDRKIAAAAWLEFCKKRTPKDLISDSTRFLWQENNLKVKINRFGHAMDPDRGVLFFANMLLGSKKVTSEIQINRSASYNARGGYKSLFDSAPQENQMRKYVEHIINLQNNIMTEENALHIITSVWGLPLDLMEKTSDGNYFISNKKLYDLLIHHSSMSVKSIFFLSTALILSNQAREPICTIKWSDTAIRKYIKNLSVCNYSVTDIEKLSLSSAKEDVVTFCSVELYKKLKFDLLAVSYPGAQGDRCVLTGSGRNVLRTYIDIIACGTDDNGVTVYLEECKANIADSQNDAEKLNEFITNPEKMKGLEKLYHKVTNGKEKFDISIGIGAKTSPAARALDVDYIFMFDIDDTAIDKTVVRYNIAIIDTALINKFSPLINENGKLAGELSYPEIYVIQ